MKYSFVGFLLAFPRYRGKLNSTTSLVAGFSPSPVTRRNYRNAIGYLTGCRSYVEKTARSRRSSLSAQSGRDSRDNYGSNPDSIENKAGTNNNTKNCNWLVVGDGDLSYSASIAEYLANKGIRLFATVLEEEEVHDSVYKRSSQNKAAILSYHNLHDSLVRSDTTGGDDTAATNLQSQHIVLFGVDATHLIDYFPRTKFSTIVFNFPHWRGKTNAKRNRILLDSFMGSAAEVLAEEGKIIISLCEGQGGFPASTAEEWKRSWLVPQYAAGHGLLLHKLKQYDPMYQQTSHRGKDRPWIKDGTDQRYIFGFPNEGCIDEDLQISCRHELRVVLPKDFVEGSAVGRQEIIEGDAVFQLTKGFVPDGIRMEVVTREILYPYFFDNEEVTLAIFLLNYSGEKAPLTRESADTIRSKVEASVQQDWNLKVAKSGRLVSRPYPTHLLPALIRESSERNLTLTNSSP